MKLEQIFDIDAFIKNALAEDHAYEDHSSISCFPPEVQKKSILISREPGIVAGVNFAAKVFQFFDPEISVNILVHDGERLQPGSRIMEIEGSARSILACERTALNIMQRLTSVASVTGQLVEKIKKYGTILLDTRKTTPGWRIPEKWAVQCGGGQNHRLGLHDAVMLKDNHIDFCGSATLALQKVQNYLQESALKIPVIIEARNFEEIQEILNTGIADRILIDNFSTKDLKEAVTMIGDAAETEASGGINFTNIEETAATGVQFISTSMMTQGAGQFDLSLQAG